MPQRSIKLSPTYTASKWETIFWAQWEAAGALRGKVHAPDATNTWTPRISNREAIALIVAWRAAIAPGVELSQRNPMRDLAAIGWPIWYQFAALAYGWTDATDRLDVTDAQAERLYPVEVTRDLWLAIQRLAMELDDQNRANPRIDLDEHAFADPDVQRDVARALREDGATAQFKIPVGCKDARIECEERPSARNPLGKGCKLKCTPVKVDDPITAVGRSVGTTVLVLLAIAIAFNATARRPRRD